MRYCIFSRSSCPILDIYNFGYSKDPEVTRFGPGVRNSYIIHYIIFGKGYFNGQPVGAGHGFLITPGMQEHYYPDRSDPWEFLWIISNDPHMADVFQHFYSDSRSNIFAYHFSVRDFAAFLTANNNAAFEGSEMLGFFLRLFRQHSKAPAAGQGRRNSDVYIQAAERYIHTDLHRTVTVAELTGFLGISQPYLFKLFKARFGLSPKQYLAEQKLHRAKTLLRQSDMTVTHIANSVGFSDVLAFSRFFTNKEGISPQKYRNSRSETHGR